MAVGVTHWEEFGAVVDFLDFYVSGYHWPAFNIADSAIVVGALLLVGEILFSKSPAEEKILSGGD